MQSDPHSSRLSCFLLWIFSLALFLTGSMSPAQDDFSLPGDEDPAPAESAPAAGGGESAPAAGDDAADPEAKDVVQDKSLFTMISEGGWAMWPLGLISIAVIALAIYLFLDISRKNFTPHELSANLGEAMDGGDLQAGLELASASPSTLGRVMAGALEFTGKRGADVLDGDSIYDLMADASQMANRKRATVIGYLGVIAQAAPMLGLLGTVSGMIKAFATLGGKGFDAPALAKNISEALMTTATGLVIALPAVFLFFFFKSRLSNFIAETELESSKLLNRLRDAWVNAYGQQ